MDTRDEELRNKIVNLLSDAFIVRRPVNPEDVASQLAKSVDLPVADLAAKVAAVAKGIGLGLTGMASGSLLQSCDDCGVVGCRVRHSRTTGNH